MYILNTKMGFVKQSIIFCILIILYTYISTLLEPKLPVNVDGYVHPAFKRVAEVFRENVELDRNPGIAFAVYHRGELLIDMWGGYADVEAQRPWSRDTIALAYSVSKGVAAIVVAKMVEKGHLDYARPVATYWPEFAQQEKGNITVEMLLSHQAGLVTLDEPVHVRDIKDNPEKVDRILARQKTSWPAGTNFGYHSLSFGPYVDTLVKKADPKGRDIVQIFKDDIADVYDLDMFMNTPKHQFYRAARIYQDPQWKVLLKALTVPKYAKLFTNFILFPGSLFARSTRAVAEFSKSVSTHNDPDLREVPVSSVFTSGTARAYAKLYGILTNGGTGLLSQNTINKLGTPIVSGVDSVTGLNGSCSTGMQIMENPKGQPVFGHPGHGGQIALADVDNGLGIAFLTNFITVYAQGDHPRYLALVQELYNCLDDYLKSKR